jgi:LacI family sucrose operon transcriptional repressor
VIEKTGYTPSQQAQTLRTKRTKVIGVVIPKIDSEAISRIVAGISSELNNAGYQLLLANTENDTEKELNYLKTFRQNIVDGIIFIATMLTPRHKAQLKSLQIPIVVLGQKTDLTSCIYHDDFHASYFLTQYVLERGRKNIGFIGVSPKDIAVGTNRRDGFIACMKDNGLEVPDTHLASGEFTVDNGYDNARLLLKKDKTIDAIICATDTIAYGAMNYLRQMNIDIPGQIAITGFGDGKTNPLISPSLTSVHYFYRTSGIEGARMLLEKIENRNTPSKSIMLGYELVKYQSV